MWYALLGRVVWYVGKRVAKRKLGPALALRAGAVAAVAGGVIVAVARARRSSGSSS
jgi:hypothetical protein